MYRITWKDENGKTHSLALSNVRSVDAIVSAYRTAPDRYRDVQVFDTSHRRFNQLVIHYE